MDAQGVESGFVTGSLAFENAARQVIGVIPLPDEDAKKSGLENIKQNYRKIELPKNSYGPDRACGYVVKDYIPRFHTITVEPFDLPQAVSSFHISQEDRLQQAIVDYIKSHPGVSPQVLDKEAGVKGIFKAGRAKVRKARDDLLADRVILERDATPEDREKYELKRQVQKVYELL